MSNSWQKSERYANRRRNHHHSNGWTKCWHTASHFSKSKVHCWHRSPPQKGGILCAMNLTIPGDYRHTIYRSISGYTSSSQLCLLKPWSRENWPLSISHSQAIPFWRPSTLYSTASSARSAASPLSASCKACATSTLAALNPHLPNHLYPINRAHPNCKSPI